MATLGSHDKPLRGRVLVDGVVTYRPSDFEIEVTKDERTASFFVPDEKMIMNWFETEDMRQAESQCAQAYQQAERGESSETEKSLLEGSRRLAPLSQWILTLVTQVEQCRRDVSGLLAAEKAEREGMVGPVLLAVQSVGCYAGET